MFASTCKLNAIKILWYIFTIQILAGANVNAMERHKRTPLHAAADNDRANILAILIQNGVNVNEVDDKNNNGTCMR